MNQLSRLISCLRILIVSLLIILCKAHRPRDDNTTSTSTRIVGGEPAGNLISRRVANVILYYTDSSDRYVCTASVVKRRWLLLAAHCLLGPNHRYTLDLHRTYTFIGEKNGFLRREDNSGKKAYGIKSAYIHHASNIDVNINDFSHDIALLYLKEPIALHKYYPMDLTKQPLQIPPMDSVVVAAGYGSDVSDRAWPSVLMKTNLILKPFHLCKELEAAPHMRQYLKWSSHVCAVSLGFPNVGRTDTCVGDSGGPLYVFDKRRKKVTQFAITSFGSSPCGSAGAVAWYTRVDTHFQAIQRLTRDKLQGAWRKVGVPQN